MPNGTRDFNGQRAFISGEFISGALIGAALLLFLALGSMILASSLDSILGSGSAIDRTLTVAFLLNAALILFIWFRHRELGRELSRATTATARAERLATTDPVTSLPNRRGLIADGSALLAMGRRRGKVLALMMFDLDHFKSVNDTHGHVAGDAVLGAVAAAVTAILPPSALFARLGGDEFACAFLFDADHPGVADRIGEQIVAALGRPFDIDGKSLHTGGSVGIARSDYDGTSLESLMRAGEIAMYAAKTAGRGRHVWFDASMEHSLKARSDLETGLRAAIPAQQIVPFFEQQIDLATGRLVGFEVLARWAHPTRGIIGPDTFIPVAEETGMIGELSLSIMRQAFVAARDWDQSLSLSINISPVQLRDAWLVQKIIKALTETGFPASRLEVEITESSLFDNLALAQSIVGSLKNQGIRIALDDFGTGYSSLAHLRALPFDRIKIDKSFVSSIIDNSESAAIVTAIASLGDSLNMPVTAEGIEDAAIEARLCAIGCARGQGYHYGRPINATNVRRILAEKHLLPGMPGLVNGAGLTGEPDLQRRAG
ncbi:diguanylate cyclase [Sphingomonas sp. Leaf17]|uniref:putative bifunctional diguanylate cyclase/phosphodiesterase n=1 Tax=Sphingomonas sp. Leaf17 TaxID=1735683 RepID=UPI0006F2E273|nr:EAL domain-containing protein [Sphingomonas sp. Leaf17]KQM65680.1 diguanylate cyclase [Sphingomonas sp. Leaf17]